MAPSIKLHNKGKRDFTVQNGGKTVTFKPGQTIYFPEEIALRLRRMYAKEIIDESAALDPFKVANPDRKKPGPKPKPESGLLPPPPGGQPDEEEGENDPE